MRNIYIVYIVYNIYVTYNLYKARVISNKMWLELFIFNNHYKI